MKISDILSVDGIFTEEVANNKRHLLQGLSAKIAKVAGLDERTVTEGILERENLGSTGYGKGTAVPHARIENAESVKAIFARLAPPIDFNAIDAKPVDLVFMLISPESNGADHLTALETLSRVLKNEQTCEKLRHAKSKEEIYAILNM